VWKLGDEIRDGDELDLLQHLTDALFPLRLADAVNDEWLCQDAMHVHERWQGAVGVLLHEANLAAVPAQRRRLRRVDRLTLEDDLALRGAVQAENRFRQAGLAAAAFAHHGDGFPFGQIERHIIDCADIASATERTLTEFVPGVQIAD
jgi:hypothetical protein